MKRLPPVTQPASESGMGHIREVVEVSGRGGGRFERLEALVDTGATYTCIPRTVLERLGIVPEEEWPFVLADGREVRYPMAWIDIRMQGRVQPTIVVFAEPGSEPILGVVTLEEFRLAVDPVNRRLISVPGLLKRATSAIEQSRLKPRLGPAAESGNGAPVSRADAESRVSLAIHPSTDSVTLTRRPSARRVAAEAAARPDR